MTRLSAEVSSSRADVWQWRGRCCRISITCAGFTRFAPASRSISSYQSDITSNYLGTYTFASLAADQARRPTSYTRRVGDPEVSYRNVQGGVYVQDDIRVRRNLTVSPGIRYELQSRLDDFNNVGPRFGVTWAPFPGGKTTIRASLGLFYDWLSTSTVEQAIRVDGLHQLELNIPDPSFPDPGNLVEFLPVSRYLLDDTLQMARNTRVSAGVDHTVGPRLRFGLLYAHTRATSLSRGVNLNALRDDVRPDPEAGNIVMVVSDARSSQHQLTGSLNAGSPPPPPFGGARGPLWDWSRAFINASYTVGSGRNNTDGDFAVAPTGRLEDEWGPASNDVRHRLFLGLVSQTFRNLNVLVNLTATSGTAFHRPHGRRSKPGRVLQRSTTGHGPQFQTRCHSVDGERQLRVRPGVWRVTPTRGPGWRVSAGRPGGAAPTVTAFTAPPARYRLLIYTTVQNLLNRSNYGGYSGTLTSPFFLQPTLVTNPRKIDFGVEFHF